MSRSASWHRGWPSQWVWRRGASTSHDPHKPSWTNSTKGRPASGRHGSGAAGGIHRRGTGPRRPGTWIFLLYVAEPAQQRKHGNQETDGAKDGSGADQAASRGLRETKDNLAAESLDDRAVATRPHWRAGTARHGLQYRIADGEPLAHRDDPQGQYAFAGGLVCVHQRSRKLYHRAAALWLFPEGRNQGNEAGRKERGSAVLRVPDFR